MISKYYRLSKPGIVKGNLITAIAGFLFASKGNFDLGIFAGLTFGMAAIMASACVFNNYIDRGIDAKMERTKSRSLAAGDISVTGALIYGTVLGILGFSAIIILINPITFILGLVAYLDYIVFYGIAKRKSVHGTLVGSIAGALPLTAGYTSVEGRIDMVAATLFFIMVFWQMTHFYSIAIYRLKDYKAAGIPVISIVKGMRATKISMLLYTVLFFVAVLYLYFIADMSYFYLIIMSAATGAWLAYAAKGFKIIKDKSWAVKMFSFSLRVLVIFSVMISVDHFVR